MLVFTCNLGIQLGNLGGSVSSPRKRLELIMEDPQFFALDFLISIEEMGDQCETINQKTAYIHLRIKEYKLT